MQQLQYIEDNKGVVCYRQNDASMAANLKTTGKQLAFQQNLIAHIQLYSTQV